MKKIATLVILLCLGCVGSAMAQNIQHISLTADNNGDTIDGVGMILYDDGGGAGSYGHGYDYYITIRSVCDSSDSATTFLAIDIKAFDIGPYDTLYIYDGPNPTAPLLTKLNSTYEYNTNRRYFITPSNTSRMLCVRFRSSIIHEDDTIPHAGFNLDVMCAKPCEHVVGLIDRFYERLDKTGNIIDTCIFTPLPTSIDSVFDSIWVITDTNTGAGRWEEGHENLIRVDTIGWTDGALLCMGQQIRFHAHGQYSNALNYYTPEDATSKFYWALGTSDTNVGINHTVIDYGGYKTVGCYNVVLTVTDVNGCKQSNYETVQVRVAQNPIKTIFDLATICNNDSLMVNVGYEGDNGTLTLKKIKFAEVVSKTNDIRTFIPDGEYCETPCYVAPVTFDEFPEGRLIQSANDICSICVNYEHSFMADYSLAILCPTYDQLSNPNNGKAYLKYKDERTISTEAPPGYTSYPEGTYGGGGTYTGCPATSSPNWDTWDNLCTHSPDNDACDSTCNPWGVGWNYCFSRNEKYTLVNDEPCNTDQPVGAGLASNGHVNSQMFQIPIMIPPFVNAGENAGVLAQNTKDSSDHMGMSMYYIPADDFSTLVGCPLRGEWKIQICDRWRQDNGWIFNWSMDLCNISSGGGCDYQVGIDSVVWRPDTNYATDFYDGLYRGLIINKRWNDSTAAYISSPDTSGDFNIKLSIYDEFGCRWDTLTHISTVRTPLPRLGNDTLLCDVATMTLNASDKYTNDNYSYLWEPFGETTSIITTTPNTNGDHSYVVEAINREKNIQCIARDTIVVKVRPQPIPNFDPGIYPLEGCEPLTINIVNTSKNGYKYRWVFGDGTYSTLKDPSHSYAAGTYDFKYYVESEGGCKDSLIYPGLVTVFPQPKAQFSWDPVYPTVLHPSVALNNTTTPDDGTNIYRWEIQYDKNNPYSFHTATEKNPTFTWQPPVGDDISGSYSIRLLARTENRGPSGILTVCSDTIENNILIINDQLEFPNMVTPNADGINDRFVIKNLVEGLAYPINQLDIYDKWGSRVFHAANIMRVEDFWDPAATNSPAGTYFYRFVGKGYKGNIEHNGVIEVLK